MKKIKYLIIPIMLIMISCNLRTYANTEEQVEKYEITQSKESEFINNINNTETDTLKIKSINKEISEKNYDTKEIYKTKTINNKNNENIYKEFGKIQEFNDGELKGVLNISDIKIETRKNGYYEKIDEKVLTFNNYTDNDLNNIEKEIKLNNTTYYLINVKWEADKTESIDGELVPKTYKGNKIYQTVQKIAYPDTYKVTVKYSGKVERIDPIYNYKVTYEYVEKEEIKEETKDNNIVPVIIISGIGLIVVLVILINQKNTYIYSKTNKGFKLIKATKLSDKNVSIDITNCKNRSNENIYAIKVNSIIFEKLKGRTISIVLGNKKKDIILWNNYYEVKL